MLHSGCFGAGAQAQVATKTKNTSRPTRPNDDTHADPLLTSWKVSSSNHGVSPNAQEYYNFEGPHQAHK